MAEPEEFLYETKESLDTHLAVSIAVEIGRLYGVRSARASFNPDGFVVQSDGRVEVPILRLSIKSIIERMSRPRR